MATMMTNSMLAIDTENESTVLDAAHLEQAVADAIVRSGYCRIGSEFLGACGGAVGSARREFVGSIRDLPPDWECVTRNRCRRYVRGIYRPWEESISWLPPRWDSERNEYVAEYCQSANLNPEYAGKARIFPALNEEQRSNSFLLHTVRTCFRALPWKEQSKPIYVGIHIIRLIASKLLAAASSPNHLHLDGEHFTYGFLLERDGVTGGENIIAPRKFANLHPAELAPPAIVDQFTLGEQFEGWVVDDTRVAHHVNPVNVAEGRDTGKRTILLVDYAVAIPHLLS